MFENYRCGHRLSRNLIEIVRESLHHSFPPTTSGLTLASIGRMMYWRWKISYGAIVLVL